MADKKISALTGASTPLAGTEVLPIVQSGSTVKVAVSDLTAGRAVGALSYSATVPNNASFQTAAAFSNATNADFLVRIKTNVTDIGPSTSTPFTISIGLSEIGRWTAAGNWAPIATKGIDYSANTPAAGMTSQLLNWYEEGTWTPVLADASTGGNTGTADFTFARYTRIGRKVFFNVNFININTTGMTAGNTLFVRGLPFASNNYCNGFSNMASVANVTYAGTMIDAQVVAGSGNIRFYDVKSATAQTLLTVAALTSGSAYLYINGSYEV